MPSLSQLYRPKRFSEVTGQRHITETLRREVATGQLGHAYVFSGPRGVGKTTTARIFAQALNCTSPSDGEPCGACANCKAFEEGRLVDVTEMDAATHTGVDNVRESIIEHVRFSPMSGKAKVYILDEAHKLSDGSWNALLKTLEEPPAYAYFILATTEWHKIPATILSRCQRFEFKRISADILATRIRELVAKQGWTIEDEVIKMIVARSEGCLRDAETLLGQLGSLADTHITLEVASLVIPRSQKPVAVDLMKYWEKRDHAGAFAFLQQAFDSGVSCLTLCDELVDCVRRLLLATALNEKEIEGWKMSADPDNALLAPLARTFEPGELHDMALMLMDRRRDMKQGMDPLFAMQLASTMIANGYLKRSGTPNLQSSQSEKKEEKKVEQPLTDTRVVPTKAETHPISSLDLNRVRTMWASIIQAVDDKNHSLPFILKISRPEDVRGNVIVIRFQYPFHQDKIVKDVKHRRIVEGVMQELLGVSSLTIEGVVGEDAERKVEREKDMVSNVLSVFGGTVAESST